MTEFSLTGIEDRAVHQRARCFHQSERFLVLSPAVEPWAGADGSYGIVKRHGGDIGVRGTFGKGNGGDRDPSGPAL